MEFAANLKDLRRGKCLTQNALARELGVSVMTISRYERGEHSPSLRRVRQIADYFEISPGELLNGKPDEVAA